MVQLVHSQCTSVPVHVPVLLREVVAYLDLRPGLNVVDGTVGAGGHAVVVLEKIGPEGRLIGLDRDSQMLTMARLRLNSLNCHLRQSSFVDLRSILKEFRIDSVDRILVDLGYSSDQLGDNNRGFSFDATGPLDMRYDVSQGEPAWRLLRDISQGELAWVLEHFGEEPAARRIARKLVEFRSSRPIYTVRDLIDALAVSLPHGMNRKSHRHPATRVFQALRIAVNEELKHVEMAMREVMYSCLKPGGILVVISFHSLEDRIVKHSLRATDRWKVLTPKPIIASIAEQRANPRSQSAKLRAAQRT